MDWNVLFFLNSVLLGVGLAMDAFSVSLANGLNEQSMCRKKMCEIAGVFAFFQALMPMTGWICVHTVIQFFEKLEKIIPWIGFVLLLFIGGKMLVDGWKSEKEDAEKYQIGLIALLVQGVATSIDALSVGFTIGEYGFLMALVCSLIIAVVTFSISILGLLIGKRFGTKLSGGATVFGGVILLLIALEILLTEIF